MRQPKRTDPGTGSGIRYPGSFLLALREAVANLNWEIRRWLGDAVECVDAEGEQHTVGLENLYRRARRTERGDWPVLIADFLGKLRDAEQHVADSANLMAVADRVLVRLCKGFPVLPDNAKVWSEPVAGTDFSICLVVDQPDTMSYVTEAMIAESDKSGSEWFALALQNLHERTPPDCFKVVHEESGLLLCCVNDAYDSSRALLLDALLPESSALGWLVAIPSRDELVVLPVSWDCLPHVHVPWLVARQSYQRAPYAISDNVYWVRQGVWRLFSITGRGQELQFQPPPEFVELIKENAPEDESKG